MMTGFSLTEKQQEANRLLAAGQTHTMLFGGSRSGKTFLICRAYVVRATKYKNSRHAMLRYRFNAIRSTIVADTFPKMMSLCFPNVSWHIDKSDWKCTFDNGSEIWFGGLDEKERTEKILGQEFCGIFLNECSQIPFSSRNIALTRLAQNCGARLRMDYDCNPPSQAHWTYKLFVKKIDPDTGRPLPDPEKYAALAMNPIDNRENLSPEYLDQLDALPERLRKRFKEGVFLSAAENALWDVDVLDRQRILNAKLPDMQRVVVAVDPSGADEENPERDMIGIIVVGLGDDGNAYVLEDLTLHAGPAKWSKVVAEAFKRHDADLVVGEENFGGAMVQHAIQTARPNTPYKAVRASRGKVVRAEPISALYGGAGDKKGKVYHVGQFPDLEDELVAFTTTGYTGDKSPNRADALVWALTEIFPGLTGPDMKSVIEKLPPPAPNVIPSSTNWMG